MKLLRHALLTLALGLYNALASVGLILLMWRNHMWNEKRWADNGRDVILSAAKNPLIPRAEGDSSRSLP